ncbi:MAG: hexose kinase [Anaerolineae bacterium]
MTLLAVTPNPALDRVVSVPHFRPLEVNRAVSHQVFAGGKGLNVARAVRNIGGDSLAAGLLGGMNGRRLAELAEQDGQPADWTFSDRIETRICNIFVSDQGSTVVNEPGDSVDQADWHRLVADIQRIASTCAVVCISGSFPPGITSDHVAAMLQLLVLTRVPIWFDSSGENLKAALKVKGVHLKINADELGAALKLPIHTVQDARIAAEAARERTNAAVAVTMGKDGAILVCESGAFAAQPPPVQAINAVGSGDSALAGLALTGASADGLRAAVAAGTANTLTGSGGAHFTREQYEALFARTTITAL